jgi:preprotein translocase subunit YajC
LFDIEGDRLNIIELLAAGSTTNPDTAPAWFDALRNPFTLIIGAVLLFMVFSGKGKRTEEKQRAEMLKQLKRGDRIQTIGGIQGSVMRAEESRVEVKVDESSNTKIWFARTAIARVIEVDKSDKTEKVEAK